MTYSSKAIANYFLELAKDSEELLTPMKLQKQRITNIDTEVIDYLDDYAYRLESELVTYYQEDRTNNYSLVGSTVVPGGFSGSIGPMDSSLQ